ncbi:hypothetical protein DF223_02045 [Mycetocola zhujimingii]|uniref:Uncharacterized protein n=1 Tax=Mycetocola zhujimingii TaxID=2079792 RepID=A0A2U1TH01_9MICO|nr:hypothetical protein DF223_02045 [Mycetocola zhujimingii]
MLVIGVMVLAVLAQGFYLWAASLMFWLGPGQSPTHDEGLIIASATSVILLAAGALVAVSTRATAFGVTVGVWAVLLLLNFGLWLVVGLLGTITVLALGCVWLVRSRRLAPSRPIRE